MKFPSIAQLKEEGSTAALRFPVSLIFGFLAAGLGCYLIEIEPADDLSLLNLLLTFALGIPLYFCIDVLAERKKFTAFQRQMAWLIGLLFLGLIYFSFPSQNTFTNTRVPYIRYAIYNLAIHLMVAFLPYFGSDNQEEFWNYNKNLFIRFVQGLCYSLVIFIGISLALLAIDALFDAKIQGETYPQIFALTFGIFNTWFFLAGIPKSFESKVSLVQYPKGLKIFTQFILIPLLLIYLCILYFYGAKIIITGDWPKGIVSYMIIAIAVLGIFTNLLLYPYQYWKEGNWIKRFHRAYYIFLIPLIILLFLAIGIRIQDYGLTVNRYIITLMGIWLAFIAIYYSLGKQNIKVIPISLSLFMILSSFGPWGMFSLSELMQRNRLIKILTEHNILVDDKIQNEVMWEITNTGKHKPIGDLQLNSLPTPELNEVNSILQYLEDYHGMTNLYPWFEQDLESMMKQVTSKRSAPITLPSEFLVESMGLTYKNRYQLLTHDALPQNLTLEVNQNIQLDITAYDYLSSVDLGEWTISNQSPKEEKYALEIDPKSQEILILTWENSQIQIPLSDYLQNLVNQYGYDFHRVDNDELLITSTGENLHVLLQVQTLHIEQSEKANKLISLRGILLIKEIEQE
ncbi:uncharacterized protein DUF4153 [Algoriphagus chordae]|uniref:Uncharacterized protein DUF4153 n=2 Tax=Algoriphagus chordae TaxID=237019 RepID=A0A2W7R8Y1_9BACT|nr:uncharacterized protein DUF4153 [Algoriphagus chordae]